MDKYGLIGYPLGHSFSKNYFNEKFENEGINAKYINFEIPSIEDLTEVLDSNPELKGLNVTIPYKEKVISYLDYVSPEANAIGAVNVIRVIHKGKDIVLRGYNSDVIGFTQSIEPFIESFHKKALILGTGSCVVQHFGCEGGSIAFLGYTVEYRTKEHIIHPWLVVHHFLQTVTRA